MFAQRSFGTGEVILTEVPVLVAPASSGSLDASRADKYEKMFGLLSTAVKRELIDVAWGGAPRNASLYETLMRINPLAVSLPLSLVPGLGGSSFSSIHGGIFLKTSRCNHRSVLFKHC
jgi:hypothetical protein